MKIDLKISSQKPGGFSFYRNLNPSRDKLGSIDAEIHHINEFETQNIKLRISGSFLF